MGKKNNVLVVLGIIIVVLLGFIAWNSYQSKPEVAYQNEQAAKEKEFKQEEKEYLDKKDKMFKDAPEGHYFTWGPWDDELYKTTWTEQQILDKINDIDTNDLNQTKDISLGTTETLLPDSLGGQSILEDQQRKSTIQYYDTLADAEADKTMRNNINKIVY